MTEALYKDRKFKSWTLNRLAETLCEEWEDLGPLLIKNRRIYERTVTTITFEGEVNVTLNMNRQPYMKDGYLQVGIGLSLSPRLDDLSTHVLNTLDLSDFLDCSPALHGQEFFTIAKTEPWNGSLFQYTAQVARLLIQSMLPFESCFDLLTKDESKIGDEVLDLRSLGPTQHLIHVKAYRLAQIYDHPEKLDEAVRVIKKSMLLDEYTRTKVEGFCQAKSAGGQDWLYTKELLERICD